MKPDQPGNRSNRQEVILLVKDGERFSEALRIGQAILDAQASVTLILLGPADTDQATHPRLTQALTPDGGPGPGAGAALPIMVCHTGYLPPAYTHLPRLSLGQLAGKMKTADLIIPF